MVVVRFKEMVAECGSIISVRIQLACAACCGAVLLLKSLPHFILSYPLDDLNCLSFMRLSIALVAALAAVPATAGPVRERSLQSILSGLLDHQEFVGGLFGNVIQDVAEELGSAKDRSQKVVDGARRFVDGAERTVERWVQDGRDYIKQNDLICE